MDVIQKIDSTIYTYIIMLQSNNMTTFMVLITNLASALFLIGLTIFVCIQLKNKKYHKYIALNLIFVFLLNQILKNIFVRQRPQLLRLIEENGYSFPSGHSMVGAGFYGFLIYLIIKKVNNKKLKYILTIVLTIIILLIGISRIYLGVHYFTDVMSAYVFAIIYLIIYICLTKKNIV